MIKFDKKENREINNEDINKMVDFVTGGGMEDINITDNPIVKSGMSKLELEKKRQILEILKNKEASAKIPVASQIFLRECCANKPASRAFTGGVLRDIVNELMNDKFINVLKSSEKPDMVGELIFNTIVSMARFVFSIHRDVSHVHDSEYIHIGLHNVYVKMCSECKKIHENDFNVKQSAESSQLIGTVIEYYGELSSFLKPEYIYPENMSLLNFLSDDDLLLDMVATNELLAMLLVRELFINMNAIDRNTVNNDKIMNELLRLFNHMFSEKMRPHVLSEVNSRMDKIVKSQHERADQLGRGLTVPRLDIGLTVPWLDIDDHDVKPSDDITNITDEVTKELLNSELASSCAHMALTDILTYGITAFIDLCMYIQLNPTDDNGIDVIKQTLASVCMQSIKYSESDTPETWSKIVDMIVNAYEIDVIFMDVKTIDPSKDLSDL